MQEPITPTTCDWCGEPFNTSAQHPRKFCSIACEEGRGPRAMDDPESPDYWLYLQGNPRALVGKWLVADGLKLVDYTPDWCKGPNDWGHGVVMSHDPDAKTYVIRTGAVFGKVVGYHNGVYDIHYENLETGEMEERKFDTSLTVDQIRQDNWWVDG